MKPPRDRRRVAAFHEAGHALAFIVTDVEIEAVTIDDAGSGVTAGRPMRLRGPRCLALALLRTYAGLAGELAERSVKRLSFGAGMQAAATFARGDYADAEDLMIAFGVVGRGKLERLAEREAIAIVTSDDAAPFMEWLAAQLLARTSVAGDAIDLAVPALLKPETFRDRIAAYAARVNRLAAREAWQPAHFAR